MADEVLVLTEQILRTFNADYVQGLPGEPGQIMIGCSHTGRKNNGHLRLGAAELVVIGNDRIVALCPGCYARIVQTILSDILREDGKEIVKKALMDISERLKALRTSELESETRGTG